MRQFGGWHVPVSIGIARPRGVGQDPAVGIEAELDTPTERDGNAWRPAVADPDSTRLGSGPGFVGKCGDSRQYGAA